MTFSKSLSSFKKCAMQNVKATKRQKTGRWKIMICNNQQNAGRKLKIIMLLQRLRWILPALIVFWTNLQLGAALPARDERSHVSANAFDPSATTSTMIRQDYNKRAPDGKNNTQSSHKLVASPAGLLRPDKFQFYTYNDKGDMITRQMTAQEIQGLIAAGGADHVAMDRQEPQKADDVLTGGKKVMDVVQKVQNVLKSALDKPPTLTGSLPKIPEHANVEWSNILPSILSGEADAISLNSESNQLSHKLTTEKIGSSVVPSAESAMNIVTSVTSKYPTKRPVTSDIQTNAYAGFTNNMQPQHSHHSQQTPAVSVTSEKPMIPVPVITLTEQKLSTLQSAITESPIFQMLSVIPVESAHKKGQTDSSIADTGTASLTTTQLSTQTEEFGQTEQFIELTLSEVPEDTTFSQLTSLGMHPVSITKQTTANLDNKGDQGSDVSAIYYSMTAPDTSIDSSTVTYDESIMSTPDRISFSNASYILIQNENNTKASEDLSFVPGVTKESQVNGTHNDDKIISQTNTITFGPFSHASVPLKPDELSNESPLHSPSTFPFISKIQLSTVPTSLHTANLDEGTSAITKELLSSVTPTYAGNHLGPLPTEIQSLTPVEPLPTQLIDSLSSVMSQVSEVRPSVLSLSSPSDEAPEISIVKINYDQGHNVSQADKFSALNVDTQDVYLPHDTNEKNVERIVSPQIYATVTAGVSPQNSTRIIDYSITQRPVNTIATNKVSTTINDVSANSRITVMTSTTIQASNAVTANNLTATSAGPNVVTSTGTMTSGSMAFSPVRVQLHKIHNASLGNQMKTPTILEITTATNAVEKHTTDKITPSGQMSPITSTVLDAPKVQSTTASFDTNESLSKPTPTKEYFDNVLANLNLSDPVSAIDQVLNIVPSPSSAPAIEPIGLPSDTLNLVANNLASGLIAGFTTSTPSVKETNVNQMSKITSSGYTVRPTVPSNVTKLAEPIENITQIYKDTIKLNVNDYQKKKNITYTQAPTQETLTAQTGSSVLIMQTKKSNYTSTKLPTSNERLDGPTKAPSSSSTNKFANNDASKDSTGQSTITERIVTVNPEQSSTMNVQPLNINKTLPDTINNQKKTENKEKIKITEASNIKTKPALSQLPIKIPLFNSADANDTKNSVNVSVHAENSLKTEKLDGKNGSLASTSPLTKEAVTIHSANDSNFDLYSSHEYHITTDTAVPNVTLSTAVTSNESSTNPAFSQNLHRFNNTTDYKKKDNMTIVQNNIYSSLPSSPSIQEHVNSDNPIVETVTQKLSSDTSANKQEFSRPSLNSTNNLNFVSNTSNQDNKNMAHTVSTINANVSSTKNISMQIIGQSDNVESKPASLKHSEDLPKPEVILLQSSTPSNVPVRQTSKPTVGHRPLEKSDVSKTDAEVSTEDKWTLISQQTSPAMTKLPKPPRPSKPPRKPVSHVQTTPPNSDENMDVHFSEAETTSEHQQDQHDSSTQSVLPLDASQSASGLDVTIRHTSADIVNFAKLCNELAFNFWVATNKGLSTARSLALSPFGMTSLLAMIFLGARGPTSDQMNEVLGLDDVATFNPHLVFQNITDAVSLARGQGIANAAFVRELFADKMKVRKLMPFYKEQAQQFYEGLVAEVNFATISDLVRRRTNLLIRKQTGGRIKDFVKTNTVPLRSPLAALSANVFQTDCNSSLTSSIGRDGELYFAVSPAVRQRKLIPVPATTWRSGVLAGYEPSIDATAVALGTSDKLISTIFVLPGQQGHTAPGDTLDRLEQRLVRNAFRDGAWNKLLKVLIPRSGLELQVPKFSHRSVVNATAALKRMGLDELFSGNADFKGINGVGHRLYLADVLQMNLFSTCGDENILGGRHHVETYPASPIRRSIRRRVENTDNFGNTAGEDTSRHISVSSQEDYINSFYRSRTARYYREKRQLSGSSERPRLKLDRPFLYFVRHNPSGIILHIGRFNPRLLP